MKLLHLLLLPSTLAFFGSSTPSTTDNDLSIPGANPLTYCEDPIASKHILQIKSVDLSPNPPEAGKTLSIKATGNFTSEVTEGAYVNLVVKLGLITLLRRREDLCAQMKEVDKECPLQEGETTVQRDVDLPKAIPPGKFVVTADVFTKDDEKITCLKAEISFSRRSAAAQQKKLVDEQIALNGEESTDL